MAKCVICNGAFHESPDSLILCQHNAGFVHLGCCINSCSYDKQPCGHALSTFEKL